MKVSVAALAFVLTTACSSQASSEGKGLTLSPHMTISCCFSYRFRKIPRNAVAEYFVTSSMCSQPAVVFITKKGHGICTNPKDAWVQQYVNDLKRSVSRDTQW
ncbi:C-C motif chemokine 14-like [Dermochelys coriacea]|uniref:C-C motif chemokine 14-like n=1 Tax=Dermochelys coriacea TaxID=27794 RepID=UPI0018E7DFE1|nr:C-C motif chemokine 14-like [Dermochelys coriacea]